MKNQDFTAIFSVDQTPKQVFDAINNVRGGWSGEVEGDTDKLGAEFTYRHKDVHRTTQKITELVPGRKVVWHVTESDLSFVKRKTSGQARTLFLIFRPRMGRRKSVLRTLVWHRSLNAMVTARTLGGF